MRRFEVWLNREIWIVICVGLAFLETSGAQDLISLSHRLPPTNHRAIAITDGGEAVLRDDGQVIAFRNDAKDPVVIKGLTNIVDVAGNSGGLGPNWPQGSAYWIALRRDGVVLQWDGHCATDGIDNCRYSAATVVPALHD